MRRCLQNLHAPLCFAQLRALVTPVLIVTRQVLGHQVIRVNEILHAYRLYGRQIVQKAELQIPKPIGVEALIVALIAAIDNPQLATKHSMHQVGRGRG